MVMLEKNSGVSQVKDVSTKQGKKGRQQLESNEEKVKL